MRHGVFAAGVLAAALAFVPSAHARPNIPFVDGDPDGPVYCPYGPTVGTASFTNVDGSAGGLSNTPADHRYTITFVTECSAGKTTRAVNDRLVTLQNSVVVTADGPITAPVSDDAGHYSFTLTGTATGHVPNVGNGETCGQGNGTDGVMSGSGPEGDFTGAFTFHRYGPHYYIAGTMTGGNEVHKVNLWLDLTSLQVSVDPRLPELGVPNVSPDPAALIDGANTLLSQAKRDAVVRGYLVCSAQGAPLDQSDIIGHGVIHDPGDPTSTFTDAVNGAVDVAADALRNVG
jgi:hypothetical protein